MAQPVNINSVYESVRDITAKESQGLITPTTFNQLASIVQLDVINELIELRNDYYRNRLRFRTRSKGLYDISQIEDMLSLGFRDKEFMIPVGNGFSYNLPADVMIVESVFVDDKAIDISSSSTFSYAVNSSLARPSLTNVMCKRSGRNVIEFFPSPTGLDVQVSYQKIPTSVDAFNNPSILQPTWSGILINPDDAYEVFNPSASTNFEIGSQAESMIVIKMLSYLGVNLNHGALVEFSEGQQAKDETQANQ